MNSVDGERSFHALNLWFNTPHGQRISDAFSEEIVQSAIPLQGDTLLQLSSCGKSPWLNLFNFNHQLIVTPDCNDRAAFVYASFSALPFDKDSFDCIISPLTFEPYPAHMAPIDELDRVLKPNGFIIYFGINPHGLWGIRSRLMHGPCFGKQPIHLHSGYFLRKAMLHRGYRACFWSTFYYIPPIESIAWVKRLEILNEVGKMLWSIPAGFYCFIVQKQTVTPLFSQSIEQREILKFYPSPVSAG